MDSTPWAGSICMWRYFAASGYLSQFSSQASTLAMLHTKEWGIDFQPLP